MSSPTPPPKIKGGKLTLQEQAYIKANIGAQNIEQIAQHLCRRPALIEDFLENKTRDGINVNQTLEILRQSHEFELLKSELTEKELKIFEKKYSQWVAQFQGDIVFSEQNQIFNAIKHEILMSNIMKQRKNMEETLLEIDNEINSIRESDTMEGRDKQDRITNLRKDKANLHGIYSAIINQYHEQNKIYSTMLKDLNASRSNRKPKEDVKKNHIMTLLEKMANDPERIQLGEEAELEKLSAEEEGNKYRQETRFVDDTVQIPFISGKE